MLPYQWSYYHNSLDGKFGDGVVPVTDAQQPWSFDISYE